MKVSFTGTRQGMTVAQKARVGLLLNAYDTVCHGDCIGADEDFHSIAILAGVQRVTIRPGHDRFKRSPTRAWCSLNELTQRLKITCTVHETEPYLIRDSKIAADGDVLIATPKGFDEEWRGSGTWATIRRAAKLHKTIQIVYPDGKVEPYKRD